MHACAQWPSCFQLFANPMDYSQAPLSRNSSGKNTGVGCYSLLQGIFPTQGSDLGLPNYRQILYHLSQEGSPQGGQANVKNKTSSFSY